MDGWIKLHRKTLKSAVFQNPNLFKVWMWCLLNANSAEDYKILFEGKEITLKPGQFVTGRFKGGKDCNMSSSTFRDQLRKLKKMKNLDIKSDNKKSLLTIINWEVYQTGKVESDISSTINPTPSHHKQEHKNKRINKSRPVYRTGRLNYYSIENFNADGQSQLFYKNNYFFITESFKDELLSNFNTLDESILKGEFYKMEDWLEMNGAKKDYKRFILNWLSKLKTDFVKPNIPAKPDFPLPHFKFFREANGQN